jgi:hypothetical protein
VLPDAASPTGDEGGASSGNGDSGGPVRPSLLKRITFEDSATLGGPNGATVNNLMMAAEGVDAIRGNRSARTTQATTYVSELFPIPISAAPPRELWVTFYMRLDAAPPGEVSIVDLRTTNNQASSATRVVVDQMRNLMGRVGSGPLSEVATTLPMNGQVVRVGFHARGEAIGIPSLLEITSGPVGSPLPPPIVAVSSPIGGPDYKDLRIGAAFGQIGITIDDITIDTQGFAEP